MNKKILNSIFWSTLVLCILITPVFISAEDGAAAGGSDKASQAIKNVETAFVNIGASIIIIGWIIAGILWLLSAGSPEKTGLAKKALIACVIGTILVAVASKSCEILNALLGLGGKC